MASQYENYRSLQLADKDEFSDETKINSPFSKSRKMNLGFPTNCGTCEMLWLNSDNLALAYRSLYCPFVLALAQGSLPREAFCTYIAQDCHFLRAFQQAYASAMKLPGLSPEIISRLNELAQGVTQELEFNAMHVKELCIDVHDEKMQLLPSTSAYISYLQELFNDPNQSLGSIMAGMVPCLRLYAFIGLTLQQAIKTIDDDHAYKAWLQMYASEEYVRVVHLAESILDDASKGGDEYDKLLNNYRSALQLEVDFFASQPFVPPPRSFGLLVVDFDDTCTAQDTTALVVKTAIKAAADKTKDPDEALATRDALELRYQWLINNYMEKRSALLSEILPVVDEFDQEDEDEFDMPWLGDFIDRISDFDREMNTVVVESEILGGIKRGALTTTGSSIEMKPGCVETLRKAVEAGIPTCVVSVNWSTEMVRAALSHHGLPAVCAEGQGAAAAGVEGGALIPGSIMVYANELEYFGDETTGKIKRRCECAADKGRIFDDLILTQAVESGSSEGLSVYIGDSMTDIPALLSADVGIVLGDNTLVNKIAIVAGVTIKRLAAYPLDSNSLDCSRAYDKPMLYQAASWSEIIAFIFNQQCANKLTKQPSFREQSSMKKKAEVVRKVPKVISIAGSDSGSGAGVQADVKTCMANGVYGMTVVTALTAQNSHGVAAVHIPPTDFIRKQLNLVVKDFEVDCFKIGMLPTPEVVEMVAEELSPLVQMTPLVVDPVLVASSGDALARAGVAEALIRSLFPLATIVTPNIPEASFLLGGRAITDLQGMKAAAEEILVRGGSQYVLLKGGHMWNLHDEEKVQLQGKSGGQRIVVDVLYDGKNMLELTRPYIETHNMHGTGCTLASAIASELAKGNDVPVAVRKAQAYVWRLIERSAGLPLGSGVQKPMNHAFRMYDWKADLAYSGNEHARNAAQALQEVDSETARALQNQPSSSSIADTRNDELYSRVPNPVDVRVYGVTDAKIIESTGLSIADAVSRAIDGGATIIQLREKLSDGGRFAETAAEVLKVCQAAKVPLIINDRVDVALAVGADGVHVGQFDLPAAAVRKILGPEAIVGVSVKTAQQAVRAQDDGADYVGAGAVRATGTKASTTLEPGVLEAICKSVTIPVVAIGGVGAKDAAMVVNAGCKGLAAVSAIFGAKDASQAAGQIRSAVDGALERMNSIP